MKHNDEEAKGRALGEKAQAKRAAAVRKAQIAHVEADARWSDFKIPKDEAGTPPLNKITYVRHDAVSVELEFEPGNQEILATQDNIAALFNSTRQNISQHLKNIFATDELNEKSVVKKIFITAGDGKNYLTSVYSLDAIIAVGYRVSSVEATKFRQWSSQIVKAYLEQGYVINEKALRDSPEKLNKLAAEVRALRSSEKHVYAKVRECFKISSSDYDKDSSEVRKFYALLQDKFHHAVTGMTSSKLLMDRADHRLVNMGLQTMKGDQPTVDDATTGKNFLRPEELYSLHLLSEQFLLFAESTALMKKQMTMKSLHEQLDRLLTLNDYSVFDGYKDFIKEEAIRHAKAELKYYRTRKELEAKGIVYDEDDLAYMESAEEFA